MRLQPYWQSFRAVSGVRECGVLETVGLILLIIACIVQFTLCESQSRRAYAWRVTIVTCLLPVWTVMDFGWPLLTVNLILLILTIALWAPEILLWHSERQVPRRGDRQ